MKYIVLPFSAAALLLTSASFSATPLNANATDAKISTTTVKKSHTKKNTKKTVKKSHQYATHQIVKKTETEVLDNSDKKLVPFHPYVTVTTSPFSDIQTTFSVFDLLYEEPKINEDLVLLQQKQAWINTLAAKGYSIDRPILQLSGGVEGQLYSSSGFGTNVTDGLSVATAELDANILASSWATGFMSIDYKNMPVSSGNRDPKSTLFLKRGFVTIGNLNVTPIYGSIGLMYVPFGRYYNNMLTSPLTVSLGRIRTVAGLLGFSLDNGLYGSVYGFSGNQTSNSVDTIKQGGVNVGLKRTFTNGKYNVGAGWVSNLADAQGEQNTGKSTSSGQFGGFGIAQPLSTASNNDLVHSVSAMDGHGSVTYGAVTLAGEYVGAVRPYATADLSFNSQQAEPKAMHVEMDYSLPFYTEMSPLLGVAYGETWQALALNLPKNSYIAFASASIWKYTVEAIEYRHDVDYSSADTASGRGATASIMGTGRTRNSVIGQVGVYF